MVILPYARRIIYLLIKKFLSKDIGYIAFIPNSNLSVYLQSYDVGLLLLDDIIDSSIMRKGEVSVYTEELEDNQDNADNQEGDSNNTKKTRKVIE